MKKIILILLVLTILGIIPTMLVALISNHIALEIIASVIVFGLVAKEICL